MKESDTEIMQVVSHELIDIHMSVSNCKECTDALIKNKKFYCGNEDPTVNTCAVLDKYLQV